MIPYQKDFRFPLGHDNLAIIGNKSFAHAGARYLKDFFSIEFKVIFGQHIPKCLSSSSSGVEMRGKFWKASLISIMPVLLSMLVNMDLTSKVINKESGLIVWPYLTDSRNMRYFSPQMGDYLPIWENNPYVSKLHMICFHNLKNNWSTWGCFAIISPFTNLRGLWILGRKY